MDVQKRPRKQPESQKYAEKLYQAEVDAEIERRQLMVREVCITR